jgi:hypothetical protein
MSRLVCDTIHCAEFAARITSFEDGHQQVVPVSSFESRVAYRYGAGRDWLDSTESRELAALLAAYWGVEPNWPPRVQRAIRLCERASQAPFFQESQPRIVTGLEAVLTTSRRDVSKQFRERVTALAAHLAIAGVSKRLADRMYDARSQAYHGEDVELFSGHPGSVAPAMTERQQRALDETRLLQRVLRSAVRKAIEDDDFRSLLGDPHAVRSKWPVYVRRCYRTRAI